jgi:hypothetical protein
MSCQTKITIEQMTFVIEILKLSNAIDTLNSKRTVSVKTKRGSLERSWYFTSYHKINNILPSHLS